MKLPLALVCGATLVVSNSWSSPCSALQSAYGAGPARTLESQDAPTNLLVILLDDVGIGDLGVYGSRFIQTPELDTLASEGVRLTSFDTSGALCSPTRASYMTGRYPLEVGFYNALFPGSQRGLAAAETTLAELLRDAGYATGHVGKWHLGYAGGADTDEFLPPAAGFTSSARLVIPQFPNHYNPEIVVDEQQTLATSGHGTEILTDFALSFLDEQPAAGKPFFLSVCYFAPHLPAQAPPEYLALYPDTSVWSIYAAMLTHVDAQIGRLLDRLETLGLADDTLVVVFSDNGGADAAGLHPDGNLGLAGYKRDVLEGGLRTPFLARWPDRIPAGAQNDSLVLSLDLLPTLLALLDVPNPLDDLPGRDMSMALVGPDPVPRPERLFWSTRGSLTSFGPANSIVDTFAVREDGASRGAPDWKLVYRPLVDGLTLPALALYDLDTDPGESVDRSAEFPELTAELWAAYWAHHTSVTEVDWSGVLTGSATPIVDGFEFVNGWLTVPPQAPFDSHDGDFTLRLTVLPLVAAQGVEQVLATKAGSWELALDASGHAELELFGQDGSTTTLVAQTATGDGRALKIGFALAAWPLSPLDAALVVDGVVEAAMTLPGPLAPNREPIVLGADALGERPFAGQLTDLHVHTSALTPAQIDGELPAAP